MTDITDKCPLCGSKMMSSVRMDFCSNEDCDHGVYYPSAFG